MFHFWIIIANDVSKLASMSVALIGSYIMMALRQVGLEVMSTI